MQCSLLCLAVIHQERNMKYSSLFLYGPVNLSTAEYNLILVASAFNFLQKERTVEKINMAVFKCEAASD